KIVFCLPVIMLMMISQSLYAQSDSMDKQEQVQFKIGAYYNSTLNYYGRTDSLRSSGFFPMAELWFNDHFYLNAAPVFVNNAVNSFQYAGTIASAGYQFNSNDKFSGNIYFVKPFYQSNSHLVASALKEQFGFTVSSLNNVLNITAGSDVKFSGDVDLGLTGGLDHIFRHQFGDESVLVIDPSAYVYAGTQQFTKSYLKNEGGFLILPGTDQLVTQSSKRFSVLSYEFSAPVVFVKGKLTLMATPAYVIPQNLVTVPNRPDLSERGKEMFYATVGIKATL
ncbi:MAG TPA: hypothetical protein VG847_03725, partial [Chitinophagaceae bacterium]|nr:hypothetical protein [Chitinophagaceae bacterium]